MAPERYSEQQDVGELKQDDPFLLFFKQNAKALIGAALIFQCCFLGFICFLTATTAELDAALLFLSLLAKAVFLTFLLYAMGWFVENRGWKVAYTRKVIHVAFFAVPFWFDTHMVSLFLYLSIRAIRLTSSVLLLQPLSEAHAIVWALWNVNLVGWILILITKPVRRSVSFVQTMYASSDRPEDKGLSQIYAWIQIPFSIVIIAGFSVTLRIMDAAEWTMIPILAVAIGDGLAEPVAVFWEDKKWFGGTHKYRTRGLFSGDRVFTRSIEGSTTVFLGTLVSVLIYLNTMTTGQLIFFVCVLPVMITILEMVAPHSLDNPFLLFFGYLIACFAALI
jgi:phytol kinase